MANEYLRYLACLVLKDQRSPRLSLVFAEDKLDM